MSLFCNPILYICGEKANTEQYDSFGDIKFKQKSKDSTEEYHEKGINVEAEDILGELSHLYSLC